MAGLEPHERAWRQASLDQPHRAELPEELRGSEKACTVLGRLNLTGVLTDHQHEAGQRFQVIVGRYRQSIGAPTSEHGGGGKGMGCVPDDCRMGLVDDCACLAAKRAFLQACRVLLDVDHKAAVAVSHVAVHDESCPTGYLPWLIKGLDALVEHFGLDVKGREGQMRRAGEIWRPA
jgi:hypothetical protein